jgi:hypothetical protein
MKRGENMSGVDVHEQRLLLLVETAQRDGRNEDEIRDLVKDAVEADAELTRAA